MPPNPWSQEVYLKAYQFAARAHNGQTVPGTDLPYIMHVTFVCMEVIAAFRQEVGHDENLAIQCALLHDVIEDTAITHAQVQAEFGDAVAVGVLALTKDEALPKAQQITDSLRRIKQLGPEIWMVKLADRITNLQRPRPGWTKEKIEQYRADAEEILETLGEASAVLATRLREKIAAYA